LRAGAPAVIVPFIVDQLYWGKRVQALGAGPAPIQAKHLSVEKLASAIRSATANRGMRQKAETIGRSIRAEDGVGAAVKIIQQTLGE
jgi:UDP:flavonoid glycosyltransferase YjiC (YdhE family)